MNKRVLTLLAAIAFAIVIAVVSALPTATKHALHTQGSLHFWLHLFGFAALAALLLSTTRQRVLQLLLLVGVLLFGYGTEVHESHKDGWPVERRDVKTDAEGVLLGLAAALLIEWRIRRTAGAAAVWRYRPPPREPGS